MNLKVNGVDREVEPVRVVSAGEPWGECLLEDGHVVRTRTIVTAVYRLKGEVGADGLPIYQVQHNVVLSVAPAPCVRETLR